MHAATDTRVVRCLDALSFSFSMLEHVHAELYPSCVSFLSDKNALPAAYWRAWSFIDLVHRIREVAQAVPGLSAKNKELSEFLSATELAETLRHYIQHLRGELSKTPGNSFPAWGNLAWVDANDPLLAHSAMSGAEVGQTTFGGCIFDRLERRWVSKVTLCAGDVSFNFDPIAEACLKFKEFVLPWMLKAYSPGVHLRSKLPIISMRVVVAIGDTDA